MRMIASLSLDLDNQWSYMKTHGDAGWETYPSYLGKVVPRILEFLDERGLTITFFIVGRDAVMPQNRQAIMSIAAAGHEIGNHSFNHEPWLHLYSKREIIDELEQTEDAINDITGCRTFGFRGPGYSLSPTVLEVLVERGYEYDCSTLPTYIGPLARAIYFLRSKEMSKDDRQKRKQLFGKFSQGFQSISPYKWDVAGKTIIEIPVTTMPVFKVPIHASYIIYLSSISRALSKAYWNVVMRFCSLTSTKPSILLHPLDFLDGDDVPELRFFPGMNVSWSKKQTILSEVLDILGTKFEIVNMRRHAEIFASETLPHAGLKPSWKAAT